MTVAHSVLVCRRHQGRTRTIESGADSVGEFLRTVRLVDKTARVFVIVVAEMLGGVAAGEEDAGIGVDVEQFSQGIAAGEARHRQIEEDEIDAGMLALVDVDGLLSIVGEYDAVAETFQNSAAEITDQRFIVHEQDGLLSAARFALQRRGRGRDGGVMARQIDVEARTLTFYAVAFDPSLVLLNDAEHHRQSQAGAFARNLGGEERLEDVCLRFRRDAGAVIEDAQTDKLAGLEPAPARTDRPGQARRWLSPTR